MQLDEVKEGKYKYPNKVYKVPVQTNFLYHFIMTSLVKDADHCLVKDDKVDEYPTEYVESMKTSDKEKQCGKIWRPVLVLG